MQRPSTETEFFNTIDPQRTSADQLIILGRNVEHLASSIRKHGEYARHAHGPSGHHSGWDARLCYRGRRRDSGIGHLGNWQSDNAFHLYVAVRGLGIALPMDAPNFHRLPGCRCAQTRLSMDLGCQPLRCRSTKHSPCGIETFRRRVSSVLGACQLHVPFSCPIGASLLCGGTPVSQRLAKVRSRPRPCENARTSFCLIKSCSEWTA